MGTSSRLVSRLPAYVTVYTSSLPDPDVSPADRVNHLDVHGEVEEIEYRKQSAQSDYVMCYLLCRWCDFSRLSGTGGNFGEASPTHPANAHLFIGGITDSRYCTASFMRLTRGIYACNHANSNLDAFAH